jgi:hypothetical protein
VDPREEEHPRADDRDVDRELRHVRRQPGRESDRLKADDG